MYDTENDVEVSIKPFDDLPPYRECYATPSTPLANGKTNECYIEAVTDQRYCLGVTLGKKFDLKGSSHVAIKCNIDSTSLLCIVDMETLANRPYVRVFKQCMANVAGQTRAIAFTFGEMEVDEEIELSAEEEANQMKTRGRITVSVRRGTAAETWARAPSYEAPTWSAQTSNKMATKKGKSHGFNAIDLGPTQLIDSYRTFKAAAGPAGQKISCHFFYTSRMFLEVNKLVPNADSAESSASTMIATRTDPGVNSAPSDTDNSEAAGSTTEAREKKQERDEEFDRLQGMLSGIGRTMRLLRSKAELEGNVSEKLEHLMSEQLEIEKRVLELYSEGG